MPAEGRLWHSDGDDNIHQAGLSLQRLALLGVTRWKIDITKYKEDYWRFRLFWLWTKMIVRAGPHSDLFSLLYTSLLLLALLSMAASTRWFIKCPTAKEIKLSWSFLSEDSGLIRLLVERFVCLFGIRKLSVSLSVLCLCLCLSFYCCLVEVSYIWLLSLTSLALWLGWVSIALILDHHYHRYLSLTFTLWSSFSQIFDHQNTRVHHKTIITCAGPGPFIIANICITSTTITSPSSLSSTLIMMIKQHKSNWTGAVCFDHCPFLLRYSSTQAQTGEISKHVQKLNNWKLDSWEYLVCFFQVRKARLRLSLPNGYHHHQHQRGFSRQRQEPDVSYRGGIKKWCWYRDIFTFAEGSRNM